MTNVPAISINRDGTPRAERFVELIREEQDFPWREQPPAAREAKTICSARASRPRSSFRSGWSDSLTNGDPIPLRLYLDGSDTNTAEQLRRQRAENAGRFSAERTRGDDRRAAGGRFRAGEEIAGASAKAIRLHDGAVENDGKILYNPKSVSSITSCRA